MAEFRHKGKVIGDLKGKVLHKTGKQVVLFRQFNGFGASKDYLDVVDKIVCDYEGKRFTATSEDFFKHGINWKFQDDAQLILPLQFWSTQDAKQVRLI